MAQAVVVVSEAGSTLGGCVEADVWGALEASSQEEEDFESCGGLGASYDREDHRGCLFSLPLAFFRQPARGVVEGDARVILFHLAVYLVEACSGGGYGGGDVVDGDLHNLDLFLEVSGRWEEVADVGLKQCSRLEEVVRYGGGDSDELNVVVGGEGDFSNEGLWEGQVDGVAEEEWCDVIWDAGPVSGDDEGPV
ncbi:hypothetical protein Q9L58_010199 [Maublancomyces gigas]|uniref:Uncharacterized protein n=1 Tax=Discina gigas TaxID=1032678 RepID=A0ABR3G4T5_9PEZI